jgi:hypothetical protein
MRDPMHEELAGAAFPVLMLPLMGKREASR